MKMFNLPYVVIIDCFIYGEEPRKNVAKGLPVIFVEEELGAVYRQVSERQNVR